MYIQVMSLQHYNLSDDIFPGGRLQVKVSELFGLIFFALLKKGYYEGAKQLMETGCVSTHLHKIKKRLQNIFNQECLVSTLSNFLHWYCRNNHESLKSRQQSSKPLTFAGKES
jgi:hypothetical protein